MSDQTSISKLKGSTTVFVMQFPEEMGINEGAYAILEPPSFTPVFCSFRAVDRPKV